MCFHLTKGHSLKYIETLKRNITFKVEILFGKLDFKTM